jgi:hypothetical protein
LSEHHLHLVGIVEHYLLIGSAARLNGALKVGEDVDHDLRVFAAQEGLASFGSGDLLTSAPAGLLVGGVAGDLPERSRLRGAGGERAGERQETEDDADTFILHSVSAAVGPGA